MDHVYLVEDHIFFFWESREKPNEQRQAGLRTGKRSDPSRQKKNN